MKVLGLLLAQGFFILIKLLIKARLGIPLLYIILCNTVWMDWTIANDLLSTVILFVLIGFCLASWIFSFLRYRRGYS